MKKDFNREMETVIEMLNGKKPKLLLHSCCGPCSSSVLERLGNFFDVTVFYYNPNIFPKEEFDKRFLEQEKFLSKIGVKLLKGEYVHEDYLGQIKGLEHLGERTKRCFKCYEQRMRQTAKMAKENGFDFFCTTLTVSPHKDEEWVNQIGQKLEKEFGVKFLPSDFKKKNGFLRSLELSKVYGFYRQNYCGCEFSKKESLNKPQN